MGRLYSVDKIENYGSEDFAKEFFPDVFSKNAPIDYGYETMRFELKKLVCERFSSAAWDYDVAFVRENIEETGHRVRPFLMEALEDRYSTWLSMREAIMLSRRFPTRWANFRARVALGLVEPSE